jgi:hypothetical protein
MSRLAVVLVLLAASLAGCSARSVVVAPEQVSKLNDSKWTVTSEPAARPR